MKKYFKEVQAILLAVCLISSNAMFFGVTGYAAGQTDAIEPRMGGIEGQDVEGLKDEKQEDIETDSTEQNIPEQTSTEPDDIKQNNIDRAESKDSNERALKENSWRYENGEPISNPQRTGNSAYSNAWSKVNGYYVNDIGEKIPGAVKKSIDISEWQGTIDWNLVKASDIDFVIIRCGFGNDETEQDDKKWLRNVSECERLGIPYGVYLYSYAQSLEQARSEAQHVLRLISGRKLSYPVYLDMEDNTTIGVSSDMKGQIAKTFCDIVSESGYKVGIYANLNWWNYQLTSSVFNNNSWSKWVAQYNSTCDYSKNYDMWQSTSKGRINGISGDVDINFWIEKSPDPVTNLKAVMAGKQTVKLTWNTSANADGYLVYSQKNGEYKYCGMTTMGTEYTDAKALDSSYNFYWVFPYIKNGMGKMIAGGCTKYVFAKGLCPAVMNLKASSVQGGVRLTWSASTGADGYLVYGQRAGNTYGYIGMTTMGTTFTDKQASKTAYNYYWVFPYHKDLNGKMIVGGTPKYTYGRAL